MSDLFSPYCYVLDLEDHIGKFSRDQFYSLVETFTAIGNKKEQAKAFAFFKHLSKEDIIQRSNKVSKLNKILMNTKVRRPL